ncbi:MAG: amidohydrolase family protein, partial [Chloroflexi bacterium]|nr:amidohydrolase family protein [Chloroflexota bacterium]
IRWGFIEAGSTWIPYVVDRLKAEKKRRSWIRKFEMGENLFKRNKFFVAVDAVEDISYVLEYGTEDSLMMGTDYSHFDTSAEPDAIDAVRRWASEGRISDTVARKILEDNPTAFYGV